MKGVREASPRKKGEQAGEMLRREGLAIRTCGANVELSPFFKGGEI